MYKSLTDMQNIPVTELADHVAALSVHALEIDKLVEVDHAQQIADYRYHVRYLADAARILARRVSREI